MTVEVRALSPADYKARQLIHQSDALMTSLYPAESNHLEDPVELGKPNVAFVGAYVDDDLVGCGAVKILADEVTYGEIKRVFVAETHRGKGVSRKIMAHLEKHLATHNVTVSRLETGVKQVEALQLYRTLGYVERGPFGSYCDDPWSVYMEKPLRPAVDDPDSNRLDN